MKKAARLAHPQKSALTTEVVASVAVGVAAVVSSVTTTEAPLEATEEAFRTGEEVAVAVVEEEATTEEVRHSTSSILSFQGQAVGEGWQESLLCNLWIFPLPSLPSTLLSLVLVFPCLTTRSFEES